MVLLFVVVVGIVLFWINKILKTLVNKVSCSKGIVQDCYVEINNKKQFIRIRGDDVNNPIMLFLHDGPGNTNSYLCYSYLKNIRDKFVLVYWDQPGCGRSYVSGENAITYEEVYHNLEEIVDFLIEKFNKRKIILIGHCVGSYLGTEYVAKNPDKVEAFVSIGQLLEMRETVSSSLERVMNLYDKPQCKRVQAYFKLLNKVRYEQKIDLNTCVTYFQLKKKIVNKLYPDSHWIRIKKNMLTFLSPDISLKDIRWMILYKFRHKTYMMLYQDFLQTILDADVEKQFGTEYKVPFYLIYGANDYFTQPEMISQFYQKLCVPRKNLIEINDAGHYPHLERTSTFVCAVGKLLKELFENK